VDNDPLPAFPWGILAPLVAVNELAEKAAMERDKDAFLQALHLDPLVSDFRSIPRMAEELWAANDPHIEPVK
jgi:alpha-galactosidase/6-phospho-beta-glucosidase family protein